MHFFKKKRNNNKLLYSATKPVIKKIFYTVKLLEDRDIMRICQKRNEALCLQTVAQEGKDYLDDIF